MRNNVRFLHECDRDAEQEQIEMDEMAQQLIDHDEGECGGVKKGCQWCEANQEEADEAKGG